jgi:hypothetical protein
VTAFLTYSQLPSVSGGLPSICNLRTHHAVVTRDPPNIATSKNLIVKSTTFPHCDIHKHTWTSDGVTHNQVDHVLVDKRRHSNILDVRSFRGDDISGSKQARQRFDVEGFDLKKLDVEVKEKYQVKISDMQL